MSDELVDLIARRFIARPDVKAIQHRDGSWSPHTVTGKRDGERIPWKRPHLQEHLAGTKTYGHYLLNTDSTCKLFAFDIDLEKSGFVPDPWSPVISENGDVNDTFVQIDGETQNLRDMWLDRKSHARPYFKLQFKQIAHKLMQGVHDELDLECAAAYSGGKGVHVYGFFPKALPAEEAREGALAVLESLDCFEPSKGENFFRHRDTDPLTGFPNLSIEIFPKQSSLDGKDLGNLMRLPLGRNQKSSDPTFFIDMTSPLGDLVPVDPVWALTTDNPWKRPTDA